MLCLCSRLRRCHILLYLRFHSGHPFFQTGGFMACLFNTKHKESEVRYSAQRESPP